MMGFTFPSSRFVRFLAAATLLFCTIQVSRANDEPLPYGGTVSQLLEASDKFAGDEIQVWEAYRPQNDEPVQYNLLDADIVRKAMALWETIKNSGLKARKKREDERIPDYEKIEEMSKRLTETYRSKRDEDDVTHYPTVLAVLDYNVNWPANENDKERVIKEQILYALAFWNGVDLQLRHIRNPKVFLRLGGIVICRNREAAKYIKSSSRDGVLNMEKALKDAKKYWAIVSNGHDEFSRRAVDFIAILTNHLPSNQPAAISTSYGFCDDSVPESYLPLTIISDNHGFDGIQLAVQQVALMMGAAVYDNGESKDGVSCVWERYTVMTDDVATIGRKWSRCTLQQLKKSIGAKSCLRTQKTFNPVGKPIERILPGRLYPALQQCKYRGFDPGYVCWNKMSCQQLVCAQSDYWAHPCKYGTAPPDGTTCGTGKLCLDDKCIDDPWPVYA